MTIWSEWPLKKEDDWKVTYTPSPFFYSQYFETVYGKVF